MSALADLDLNNRRITTPAEARPEACALAIANVRILAIGAVLVELTVNTRRQH
jgi:predicted amidohydrolase YtcJ